MKFTEKRLNQATEQKMKPSTGLLQLLQPKNCLHWPFPVPGLHLILLWSQDPRGRRTTYPTRTSNWIVFDCHVHSEANTVPYTYFCVTPYALHKLKQLQVLLINVDTISFKEIAQPKKTMYIKILNDGAHIYKSGCFPSMKARDTCTITSQR